MSFGEILKEIRKENGESLRRLAEKIDIAFSYIDRIEKNKNPISKNVFEKILKIYPLHKEKLMKAYMEDTLPDEILKNIGLKIENDFLDNMKDVVKMLDKESQKMAFLYIIERLEYTSLKNGTYDKIKTMLDKVKERVEKS
jgi:transcriptional regulator with XRE-family HTH domain|nr:helix-turn-helix transcriptional regulator [Fusobacterium nucleatum]